VQWDDPVTDAKPTTKYKDYLNYAYHITLTLSVL